MFHQHVIRPTQVFGRSIAGPSLHTGCSSHRFMCGFVAGRQRGAIDVCSLLVLSLHVSGSIVLAVHLLCLVPWLGSVSPRLSVLSTPETTAQKQLARSAGNVWLSQLILHLRVNYTIFKNTSAQH
jgi:hypothetical protein